jgi:DNA-binding NarL/FixJ family response regulator
MVEALRRICEPFGLSPREFQVVCALVDGHVTARDLGRYLGIGESTVYNYIESISAKTGLHGKSEVIAFVARQAFQLFSNARFFIRPPSVLVIDDDRDLADGLTDAFRGRGCRATSAYDAKESLIERIEKERVDLIVCDFVLAGQTGVEFLAMVARRIPKMPVAILISGSDQAPLDPNGSVLELVRKPLDFSHLFDRALEGLIVTDRDPGRQERAGIAAKVLIDGKEVTNTLEISARGMSMHLDGAMRPGQSFAFQLQLPEQTVIRGEGEAVWREDSQRGDKPGRVGVRFRELAASEQEYLRDYVHTKNILRFLPIHRDLSPRKRSAG